MRFDEFNLFFPRMWGKLASVCRKIRQWGGSFHTCCRTLSISLSSKSFWKGKISGAVRSAIHACVRSLMSRVPAGTLLSSNSCSKSSISIAVARMGGETRRRGGQSAGEARSYPAKEERIRLGTVILGFFSCLETASFANFTPLSITATSLSVLLPSRSIQNSSITTSCLSLLSSS